MILLNMKYIHTTKKQISANSFITMDDYLIANYGDVFKWSCNYNWKYIYILADSVNIDDVISWADTDFNAIEKTYEEAKALLDNNTHTDHYTLNDEGILTINL